MVVGELTEVGREGSYNMDKVVDLRRLSVETLYGKLLKSFSSLPVAEGEVEGLL